MDYNWVPWKFILRRLARTGGFIDPVALLAQFNKFSQPSEVAAPVELLRAGMVFHARGLINARTIQGNLDWIWPFWVAKQFDPMNEAFVPRSFALTHVNLTNRNWTAVGLPDHAVYPIVDPRGLVTPHFDGWSLDAWIVNENGHGLIPSKTVESGQKQLNERDSLKVETDMTRDGMSMRSLVEVLLLDGDPVCRIRYSAVSNRDGAFVVALRPFNPEGVSFIDKVAVDAGRRQWTVNNAGLVYFDPPMNRHVVSEYRQGDVYAGLWEKKEASEITCPIGMASAAAVYPLRPQEPTEVSLTVPLDKDPEAANTPVVKTPGGSWREALRGASRLNIPDEKMMSVYDAAVRTLVLLSPLEIYPGPFYYKRFWFRDAVFILHAFLGLGFHDRAERAVNHFLGRQKVTGYFESQKGEWDSNGQVLWIFRRFAQLTGKPIPDTWLKAADKAARWIVKKRLRADSTELQAGLFPAGFSAEHLGNNDFYFWDDFWGIAGLKAAAGLCEAAGEKKKARTYALEAEHFELCVERSLQRSKLLRNRDAIPASPYRRMDAGAIGSIIAGYPLQLWSSKEPRLLNTLEYLMDNCFIDRAFFQDMTHSGFNIYLTLHCAQCLLRAGDRRFWPMVEKVAELASPTGHWPEAVHPQTLGGCMGDGQHAWAAAEWVMMIHNMFALEEGDTLILLSGIPENWLEPEKTLEIGPLHTRFGALDIVVKSGKEHVEVNWVARWRTPPAEVRLQLNGFEPVSWDDVANGPGSLRLYSQSN